jgi:hypothetical protein
MQTARLGHAAAMMNSLRACARFSVRSRSENALVLPFPRRILTWLAFLAVSAPAWSADAPTALTRGDIEASYLHVAVMGSGTYSIRDQRLTMLRLPFSRVHREPSEEAPGLRWLLPVTVGYDDLTDFGTDIIERLLPDELVTVSALPGVEWTFLASERWQLRPFVQLGAGRDFAEDETFAITHFGVRALGLFELDERWTLRWGHGLRWGGEYRFASDDTDGFGVLETGLDLRRRLPFRVLGDAVDVGAYTIYQRFLPRWRLGTTVTGPIDARDLLEVGLSTGFERRRRFLGIPYQRLRVGFKFGPGFRGVTIGTDFPF